MATGCSTLATLEQSLFLASGGCQDWLNQGKKIPSKLKKLEKINLMLCKTPRLLTCDHIKVKLYIFCHNIYQTISILQSLTDGDESFSITEAVQALGKIIFCQWIFN